jgi:hypothetical protein
MSEFKRGDWFRFKVQFEPEHVEMGEKFRVEGASSNGMAVSYVDPMFTDWQFVSTSEIEKVKDPHPKLTKLMSGPSPFARPEEVQGVLDRAERIIHPDKLVEGDWEALHSMEDELHAEAYRVMLEFPQDREEILRKMLEVVALEIPRW